jgi:hypothetical protein
MRVLQLHREPDTGSLDNEEGDMEFLAAMKKRKEIAKDGPLHQYIHPFPPASRFSDRLLVIER